MKNYKCDMGGSKDMPNSTITKNALANSFKKLMQEQTFDKINVTDICDNCNMSRKSFYYHFKDKYDLITWIFNNEFLSKIDVDSVQYNFNDHWDFITTACEYFYENRSFYKKILQIKGQNSFSDYLRQCLHPLLRKRLTYMFDGENVDDFTVDLFADFTLCVIERWLLENDDITPKIFVNKLHTIICRSTVSVYNEIENN